MDLARLTASEAALFPAEKKFGERHSFDSEAMRSLLPDFQRAL
jgi:hypothetical protein